MRASTGGINMTNNHIQIYTCESGKWAKIIIPENATKDDLAGIKEMLDVIIKRHFQIESEDEQ
jgi:hypothetical protein